MNSANAIDITDLNHLYYALAKPTMTMKILNNNNNIPTKKHTWQECSENQEIV